MKITLLKVEDYRAIKDIEIAPGERSLLLLGGNNCAGKSSVLSAIESALGGSSATPPEPVRHGAKHAKITLELDDGAITIQRIIDRGGRHRVEVRADGAKARAPQKMLDAMVGARFLDPIRFLALAPKKQREMLLHVAKIDIDLDANAAERATAYDERRDIGRDLRRLQAVVEQAGAVEEEPAVASVGSLSERAAELRELHKSISDAEQAVTNAEARVQRLTAELAAAQDEDRAASERLGDLINEHGSAFDVDGDIKEIDEQIGRAAAASAAAATIRSRNESRAAARQELAEISERHDALTDTIDKCDADRERALRDAEMPIEGLDVDAEHVIFDGAPLEQASDAQRLRVSLSIAAALASEVSDVWIRDGALLDEHSLAAVRAFAEASGRRIWVERVGDGDDDAIVMEDGKVRDAG
jgi:DNA repair ATPase RecN